LRHEVNTGGTQDTITFTENQVPLKLQVTPKISLEEQNVDLNIDFSLENVTSEPASVGEPPKKSKQATKTLVTVSSGDTAVIGGLVRDSMTKAVSKVPVMGDIPLLGLLFRKEITTKKKKEVIIFITPTIVED
jgi:type II secretory pathway component GspD/PulD (secretin)